MSPLLQVRHRIQLPRSSCPAWATARLTNPPTTPCRPKPPRRPPTLDSTPLGRTSPSPRCAPTSPARRTHPTRRRRASRCCRGPRWAVLRPTPLLSPPAPALGCPPHRPPLPLPPCLLVATTQTPSIPWRRRGSTTRRPHRWGRPPP